MRFDICLPNAMEGFLAPTEFAGPREIAKFAVEAEGLGYNAVWGFDFVNPTPDMGIPDGETANWYELMTTLSYVAGVTERIRLVAGVVVLPNRDPIMLAKQVATVDQFSQGRLDLGIGLGLRPEFLTMQPRLKGVYRGELVDEKLEALKLLLDPAGGLVSYDGKHVAFSNVKLNPKPLQNPLPMLTAAETPAPLKRAARWGLNPIVHYAALDERIAQFEPIVAETGKSMSDFDLSVWADLRVDVKIGTAAERYLQSNMAQTAMRLRKSGAEQIVHDNWVGTVDSVVEQLVALKRRGVDRLIIMHTVNETFDEMLQQTEVFATEIIPRVESA